MDTNITGGLPLGQPMTREEFEAARKAAEAKKNEVSASVFTNGRETGGKIGYARTVFDENGTRVKVGGDLSVSSDGATYNAGTRAKARVEKEVGNGVSIYADLNGGVNTNVSKRTTTTTSSTEGSSYKATDEKKQELSKQRNNLGYYVEDMRYACEDYEEQVANLKKDLEDPNWGTQTYSKEYAQFGASVTTREAREEEIAHLQEYGVDAHRTRYEQAVAKRDKMDTEGDKYWIGNYWENGAQQEVAEQKETIEQKQIVVDVTANITAELGLEYKANENITLRGGIESGANISADGVTPIVELKAGGDIKPKADGNTAIAFDITKNLINRNEPPKLSITAKFNIPDIPDNPKKAKRTR